MENKPFKFWFDLPNIRAHKYSANYFLKTARLLQEHHVGSHVATMQFICFNDEKVMISGVSEVVALLFQTLEHPEDFKISGVPDGTVVDRRTPILKITGPYAQFAHLENIIDGILARRSSVTTNCWRVLNALAPGQQLIYMNDRNDDYTTQPGDGYAAYVAGIRNFVTEMQTAWLTDPNIQVMGTIPHALIQQYHNDLPRLVRDFNTTFHTKPTVLIDYENDVVKTLTDLLPVSDQIAAVRIDTSKHMVDRSLQERGLHGVNPTLVSLVRHWLDDHQLPNIKIVVSSGITLEQIQAWHGVPIDVYGVGSYFLTKTVSISADLVEYDGEPFAKTGRHNLPPPAEWIVYTSGKK